MITATPHQIAAAFTEWERRFREEPERFQSESVRLIKETPETYGAAAMPYFLKILGEIQTTEYSSDTLSPGIDSDSTICSCNCLIKSPNYLVHHRGCKYRLICERNEARDQRAEARRIAKHACELLAANSIEVDCLPLPWEEASPKHKE